MTELALTVAEKVRLAADVVGLTLVDDGRTPLPTWTAGAHVDVRCGSFLRQYSLCGDPEDRQRYRIAVLREPQGRGGSAYLHDELGINDSLHVSPPRNTFALVPAARYVFIAGGIGITPILPMLAQAERAGAQWTLHYGGRTRAAMAYVEELRRHGDKVHTYPQDEIGLLPLAEILEGTTPDTEIYCCGPPPLLDAVNRACPHWPPGTLHVEHFSPAALDAHAEHAFDVRLARSGSTHHVPSDRSILAVLAEAGVPVGSSCEVGTCGTCETTVLDGAPDHRDSVLTAEEKQDGTFMMLCVSRAHSDQLVLDL